MKERDSALKADLKSKLVTDRLKFVGLRNKVTKEIRKAKANFYLNVIDQAKGNTELIWENIKRLKGKHHSGNKQCFEIYKNNSITQDEDQIVSAFNSYFVESVSSLIHNQSINPLPMMPVTINLYLRFMKYSKIK